MSEASKAAEEFMVWDGALPPRNRGEQRGMFARMKGRKEGHIAGARALLEWARSKQIYGINIEGKTTPFGTVNLSDLEAYFAEEK